MFGRRAFTRVPRDKRSKLDSKIRQCIFLHYAHEFGYRLWDPQNKKVIRSRDITFFEDQTIDDIEKTNKSTFSVDSPVNLDIVPPPVLDDDHQGPPHVDIHVCDMQA